MIMTTTSTASTASSMASSASPISLAKPSPRSTTPTPPDSISIRHLIYRGLTKSSMEYMSLAHSNKQPEAAHTLKGEILISGRDCPGYIQYCITLDQEWMTRRVMLTAMFDGSQEKRVVLEVDQNQRWYKVTEHRLARSRSFFRSGIDSPARQTDAASSPRLVGRTRDNELIELKSSRSNASSLSRTSSESLSSAMSMQDADASFSDAASCCSSSSFSSSSSDDIESSIPLEKINLTWTPPAKGSKRGSKRFSSFNPLKDVLPSATASILTTASPLCGEATPATMSSCVTTPVPVATTGSTTIPDAASTKSLLTDRIQTQKAFSTLSSPPSHSSASCATMSPDKPSGPTSMMQTKTLRSPVVEFANRTLSKSSSTSSLNGSATKSYEHLPALDGCIHFDLGGNVSPSTLLLPLRRATLGIDADDMQEHLESLMTCPSAVTSEWTVMVSFPDLEPRAVRTHVAYVGQGSGDMSSIVECWTDEDDDDSESTLVEVDEDGLAVRYGDAWARIPTW